MQHLNQELTGQPAQNAEATQKLGVENVTVGKGPAPTTNQPPPGSQNQATDNGGTAPAAPERINDIQTGSSTSNAAGSEATANNSTQNQQGDKAQDSTSKKKGKKGLRKLIPF